MRSEAPRPSGRVAVGSIRPRILKGENDGATIELRRTSCSGLDPTEDTERRDCSASGPSGPSGQVAVGSIRPRILKVFFAQIQLALLIRCSGLDPTEDTEREWPAASPWVTLEQITLEQATP